MLRKTLTILSLIGLLLSVGLWVASGWTLELFVGRQCCLAISGRLVLAWAPNAHSV